MTTAVDSAPQVAVRDIVRKLTSIGTLPETTARIVSTVEDPRASSAQLHKIVAHDPALVTRILKVVNSAFYGLPGQIASVERAIVLLGVNAVKNIAIAASLGKLFKGVKLCDGFTAKDLWTHCVAVGLAARDMARRMRVPLADEAFLAGMIHDLGLLVSLQTHPAQLSDICHRAKDDNADFCAIEQEIMGMDHQQLGAALCEHWKFPRSCQLVAGYHHRPAVLADDSRLLVTLVYAADTMCAAASHGFNLTAKSQSTADGQIEAVGLRHTMIEHTSQNLPELMSSCAAFTA